MVSFNVVNADFFMKRALSLAARARGCTTPNPMVGAVVVKGDRIIAEGYHRKAGTPHAEAMALEEAGERARGATLYVTLEPCCHRDKRTPPCTDKIISSGISRVVVAMTDPNPKVSGRGIKELEKAGITVTSGLSEKRAIELNEYYIKHVTTGTPFVILKVAMTLDGKIATPEGQSQWITGEKARKLVHRLRGEVDAVMTGIGTVRADDPRLTCRSGGKRSPMRVIIDPRLEIKPEASVLTTPPETVIVTLKTEESKRSALLERGITLIEYEGERVDMGRLMKDLGGRGIMSVLVEGGASLNYSCLDAGIVDKVMFFLAPKIIGGRESYPAVGGRSFRRLQDAFRIRDLRARKIGDDFLLEGYLVSEAETQLSRAFQNTSQSFPYHSTKAE
jgi:diaminohydroxyphosphoribosylaminopyrimidine deaminase/5-amino-6-(5-phosphoribosylamino)uracil reductase